MFTENEKLKIADYLRKMSMGQEFTLEPNLLLRVELELASIFNHMSQDDKYNYGSPENYWLSCLNFELLGELEC